MCHSILIFYFQAFASESVFGILSETLYNLLQLVSVSLCFNVSFLHSVRWLPLFTCLSLPPRLCSFRTGSRDRKKITC